MDLSPIISTQGHVFGVGPLLKTNRIDPIPTFFNNLPSASSISPDLLEDVLFSRSTYSFWNTPGSGVNAEFNNPGQPFDASKSLGSQFSVVQGSFSFGYFSSHITLNNSGLKIAAKVCFYMTYKNNFILYFTYNYVSI